MLKNNPIKATALRSLKGRSQPLAALTAYDYPTGRLLDEAGIDMILVGDSLGMVVLGYEDTTSVTLADMLRHTAAVRRGVEQTCLVADMPIFTYDSPQQALDTAHQLVAAGADAVKLEGGAALLEQIVAILGADIPVVGHLGMLPQHVREEGGYHKKGRSPEEAQRLLDDARALDEAGVCSIVLESVVGSVAEQITTTVACPTIGIGSGNATDGQVRVIHDILGAFPWFVPPFAVAHANLADTIRGAVQGYLEEISGSHTPSKS